MCDSAYCGSGGSSYNDCLCQSGTCSYSGYCTSQNYYYDFYNECYNYTIRGYDYYYSSSTNLVWLWWVISIVTTLIIVAVIITVVCCIKKKRRQRELGMAAYTAQTNGAMQVQQQYNQVP